MAISLPVFAGAFALSILYYLYTWTTCHIYRNSLKKRHGCLPPTRLPQKDPILGTDVVLANLSAAKNHGFLELIRTQHAKYGRTFTTNTFFRTTINTCDPRVLQAVLSLQFEDFGMGPLRSKAASPLLGNGIFTTDNEHWSHQRALIRPSFVRSQVTDFSIFETHVDQLIQLIARENYVVDLQHLMFRMVLDSNSEYLFGEPVGLLAADGQGSAQAFHDALDIAQKGTILRMRLGNLIFAHRDANFTQACADVHTYADQFVTKALEFRRQQALHPEKHVDEGEKKKYVFLNELAKDTEDPIVLRDQIVSMLLAARDTTAGLISFTFFMLARNKRVWDKLREEVLSCWTYPLTYDAVQNMTYLRYVLQETLRLFPPIATNSRMANKDTVLPVGGGPNGNSPLFVAKNNVVMYSVFAMHRREELFGPDALEFRPERWESLRPGWEYLPFNGGPRICPGQKFALIESSYTVARLLQAFAGVESLDEGDFVERITLSLTMDNGVKCRFVPAETA